jgi:hypothetical protein
VPWRALEGEGSAGRRLKTGRRRRRRSRDLPNQIQARCPLIRNRSPRRQLEARCIDLPPSPLGRGDHARRPQESHGSACRAHSHATILRWCAWDRRAACASVSVVTAGAAEHKDELRL